MGGSGVTALRNGERQTSGQGHRGNRAGTPGLGLAKGSVSGPWGVVDYGTSKANTGIVGSKHKVKGVALTPNPQPGGGRVGG